MNKAVIIPTGKEIMDGIVLDTNSPAVMLSLIGMNPLCMVCRDKPIADEPDIICQTVEGWIGQGFDLVALIGGSGGGHRHNNENFLLSADYSWSALEALFESDEMVSREIWGKNGHLWCKLVCGVKNGALIINLPGPHVEAKAAIEAFCNVYPQYKKGSQNMLDEINAAMVQAVLAQYPKDEL